MGVSHLLNHENFNNQLLLMGVFGCFNIRNSSLTSRRWSLRTICSGATNDEVYQMRGRVKWQRHHITCVT